MEILCRDHSLWAVVGVVRVGTQIIFPEIVQAITVKITGCTVIPHRARGNQSIGSFPKIGHSIAVKICGLCLLKVGYGGVIDTMKSDEKLARTGIHENFVPSVSERHERRVVPALQIRRPLIEISTLGDSGPFGPEGAARPLGESHLLVERIGGERTGRAQETEGRRRQVDGEIHGLFRSSLFVARLIPLP